jgi:4-carboxymuconolactone decarboxylase
MMDIEAMRARGLALRKALFGEATVEKRMTAAGPFGQPLQDMINGYAYGDLWQRPGLSPKLRSLTMVAMMAAVGRPNELRVHLNGARKNGVTADEVREVLLQVALYCGLPLSIEAHTIAHEVFGADGNAGRDNA